MDQGVAAVLAGVAGLIGAGIGGLSTAYGARIGANKSIEAAQTQVRHQASAEHEHWIREQRSQACGDVMAALERVALSIVNARQDLGEGQDLPLARLTSAEEAMKELMMVSARLALWGPQNLVDAAMAQRAAANDARKALVAWSELGDADRVELQRCKEEYHQKIKELGQARRAFASCARTTLGKPR